MRARCLLYDIPGYTPYWKALHWQRELFRLRTSGLPGEAHPNVVLALEHEPVFTLGRAASQRDLHFPGVTPNEDDDSPLPPTPFGFSAHRVERGGKVTYHGPGQLVVYPILDLRAFRADLHWYVESIEEVIIKSLKLGGGVSAFRVKGSPGVWTGVEGSGRERKIAAVGMNCSKWYTQHGFAINVNPNLSHFEYIVPCGVAERGRVTSLEQESGGMALGEFKAVALKCFEEVFECDLISAPLADLPVLPS